LLFVIKLI